MAPSAIHPELARVLTAFDPDQIFGKETGLPIPLANIRWRANGLDARAIEVLRCLFQGGPDGVFPAIRGIPITCVFSTSHKTDDQEREEHPSEKLWDDAFKRDHRVFNSR